MIQLQIRRGTLAEWSAENTVLLEGEHGYATDVGLHKVGDGVTAWNDLRWAVRSMQITRKVVTSTDYTILDDDGYEAFEFSTGASDRVLTLPTAADNVGRQVQVIKTDSGAGKVTVDGEGTEKIGVEGNATTFDLYAQGDRVTLRSNGTLWVVVDTNGPLLTYTSTSDVAGSTTANTWANPAGHSLSVPPGVWEPEAAVYQDTTRSSGTGNDIRACISTSNSSATDSEMVSACVIGGATNPELGIRHLVKKTSRLVVAATTTYYLNIYGSQTMTTNTTRGASAATKLQFRRVG